MSAPVKGGAAPRPPLAKETLHGTGRYQWVYLWGWPIRAMHWTAALCIVVLVITGFYIGRPYFMTSGEASANYLMGKVRFWHFVAAGVLVATAIVRFYWLFRGNKFERWGALYPVRPRDWANLWRKVKYYLMIDTTHDPQYMGHNPLQQLSYTFVYFIAAIMAITGFAMYGQAAPEGFFYTMFNWVVRLLGGIQRVHFVHHILTWLFIIFVPIHVYLALRADTLEHTGTISSIISGGRFLERDQKYVDE